MQYINCSLEDLTTRYPLVSVGTTLAERIAQILRQLMAIKPGEKASSDSIESFCTMIMEADRDALCAKLILPIGMRVDIREEIAAYLMVYTFETFVPVNGDLAWVNPRSLQDTGPQLTEDELAYLGKVMLHAENTDLVLIRVGVEYVHAVPAAMPYLQALMQWDAEMETQKASEEESEKLSDKLAEATVVFATALFNDHRELLEDWMLFVLIKEEVL